MPATDPRSTAQPAETTTDFLFPTPTRPMAGGGLEYSGCGRTAIPARFGLDPNRPGAGAVPDGARGLWAPARSTIELQQLLNTTHRAGERLAWRFAPATRVMQVANSLREGGVQTAMWDGGNDRCRCARTDGAVTLREAGGFAAASDLRAGARLVTTLVPALTLQRSTRARASEIPRRGESPCSPSTDRDAAAQSGVHRHHPCAAGGCWSGQKKALAMA